MQLMLIFLPLAVYLALFFLFLQRMTIRGVLEALVKSHLILFAFIAVSTELFSLLNWIAFPNLLVLWVVFLAVCVVLVVRRGKKLEFKIPRLQNRDYFTISLTAFLIIVITVTFFTALVYPPNTWDSMTYHMSRVEHWVHNQNVSFYPTEIVRQNYQMPLAEFGILHLQVLTASDLYANLIQWASFVISIVLGILIASEIGLTRRQQLLTAVFIASTPMVVLQASGSQNDLVVAGFIMAFAFFMMRLWDEIQYENLVFAALGLGLALFSKGTAFVYGAGVGTLLAIPLLLANKGNRADFVKTTAQLASVVAIALVFSTGQFVRNYQLYGNPFSTEGEIIFNKEFSLKALGANMLRNGVLHLIAPSRIINETIQNTTLEILGTEAYNPNTTFANNSLELIFTLHEDLAGNLVQFAIIILGVVTLPFWVRQDGNKKLIWYLLSVTAAMLVYNILINWQLWASRLHTPLFVLAAPLAATILSPSKPIRVWRHAGNFLAACMILYSLPFVFANQTRPLLSADWYRHERERLYFTNRDYLYPDYQKIVEILKKENATDVGLYIGVDDWEYPLWALGKQHGGQDITFRHVGVSNISSTLEQNFTLPDYVIATRNFDTWEYAGDYEAVFKSKHLRLFEKRK